MLRLRSVSSPAVRLVGCIFFAAIWNGILGFFLFLDSGHSGLGVFLGMFMVPFVLVGLGSLGMVFYLFLALFLPRPTLLISKYLVRPGEEFKIEWSFSGRKDRISTVKVDLVGNEEVIYRRGTDTHTDRSEFYRKELSNQTGASIGAGGSATAVVPAGTIHSLAASHNKIIWRIHLHAAIDNSPDIKEDYELVVLPG